MMAIHSRVLVIVILAFILLFVLVPATLHADEVGDLQAQLQELLSLVDSLQKQISNLQGGVSDVAIDSRTGNVTTKPSFFCSLTPRLIGLGDRGTDVNELQRFLAQNSTIYPEGLVTGFFGPLTQTAVQRLQTQKGVVSSGNPTTTGYGVFGPRTRSVVCSDEPIREVDLPITPVPFDPDDIVACPAIYAPVCGQFGDREITYSNRCSLDAAKAKYLHEGECKAPDTTPEPEPVPPEIRNELSFETITNSRGLTERTNKVVKDNTSWQALWDDLTKNTPAEFRPELPVVDFSQEMVIGVFMGSFSSGGNTIEINKIIETNDAVEVSVEEMSPGNGCAVTAAFDFPSHIVKTKSSDKTITYTVTETRGADCFTGFSF